jgi:ribosomal protein S18 acetylase RimI-like enzyme
MTIRKATAGDLAWVEKVAKAAYEIYVERIGKKPAPMIADFESQIAAGRMDVWQEGAQVAGFIVHYPREDHLHIENVAVHPACAGQGIGGKLIALAEENAREKGFSAVELYTNEKMTENLSFYPHLGYRETGRREEAGFSRIYFRKELG